MEKLIAIQVDTHEKVGKAYSNFKKAPKERIVLGYVESRLETLEKYWLTFKNGHDQLVSGVPVANRHQVPYFEEDIFDKFEELYYTYKGDLKTAIDKLKPKKIAIEQDKPPSPQKNEVKLPRITLPVFSGSYNEWQSFYDLFSALIHRNNTLENVQKLHYLKTNLAGEAEALLRQFPITGDNYETAWQILIKRYSNKRYITNCIFKRLFGQKTLNLESAYGLKQLLDTTVECITALKNQKLPVQYWDAIIIYIVVSKLDSESHKQWEEAISADGSDEIPSFDKLTAFLEMRFRTLEMIESSNKSSKSVKPKVFYTTVPAQCGFCHDSHFIFNCKKFVKLPTDERYKFVQTNGLCFNCLVPNHSVSKCKQSTACRICSKKHHSLLHLDRKRTEEEKQGDRQSHKDQEEEIKVTSHFSIQEQPGQNVLLATALVDIPSRNGKIHVFRALIDQGSQASFVTENMVQLLGLTRKKINGVVSGIGEGNKPTKYIVEFTLRSRYDATFTIQVQAYVLNTLTTYLPSHSVDLGWPKLAKLDLADPSFNIASKIDVLLGAAVLSKIIESGLMKGPFGIIAQSTRLGWILSGESSSSLTNDHQRRKKIVSMHTHTLDNDILKKFWELDSEPYTAVKIMSKEEKKCNEIYAKTTTREETGRYVVHLPLQESLDETINRCGNTKQLAIKRLLQLEKQFERNSKLKKEYMKVIQEYKDLGHMKKTNDDNKMTIYLPHHAVIREDKETTKVRVVYNASAKGSNGYSLNDNLLVGPVIQPDLRTLLIKWRTHKICIVGDITKMYRQIKVTPKHTDLQRIVWRDDPKTDIEMYKLLTVTFGTASAPFLAVKTLSQLAFDEQYKYPLAAEIVRNSFYMDDLMTGAETIEAAKVICNEVTDLLTLGGFEMQKWSSNSDELLKEIFTKRKSSTNKFEIKMDKVIKILGLTWDRNDDMFKFTVNLPTITQTITKRTILSYLTRLFDPFGWLAPVLITAKVMIQKLWLLGVDWDQELPVELAQEWLQFQNDLINLKAIKLRRWLNVSSCNEKIEIHGFADASMVAYAAVAYLKATDKDGKVHINIIAAKSRVAPLKQISVPRLELCAATLLAKLLQDLMIILNVPKHEVYAWTDSTIVLAWLQSHPSKWQTFVANRVSEITQIIDNTNWRHVQSSDNPADLPSRGISASDLEDNELWWKGPKWLQNKVKEPKILIIPETEIEKRKEIYMGKLKNKEGNISNLHAKVLETKHVEEKPFWEKYSCLIKVKRIVAYCRRFITRRQLEEHDDPETLKVTELVKALETVIKYYQRINFSAEIKQLKEEAKIHKTSILSTLSPFLDENGVLRVGGRLQNAHISFEEKHPCIIPSNTYLTWLLVQEAHRKTLHGGNQLTLAMLRRQFFILNARREVKKFIRKCVICVRHRAATNQQIMGQLPTCRVNPGRAFETSGVDYAGPVKIRMSKGRGYKATKGYICLFVCMSTRAVHIEAVTDMTTEAFLAAFRRFVSRRGHCKHLWSDNGSNFIGAAKELRQLLIKGKQNITQEVSNILSNDGTTWHFIPPKSPNFGGIWEAAIKSAKYHLSRIIGESTLTYEEMATLLTQIEACLNSRPLCRDTTTDDNFVPLTPGHFLIGEPIIGVPEINFKNESITLLTRWQGIQRMTQHFWKRWSSEYLHTLQHRYRWKEIVPNPKLGDIVVIKDEDLPPTKWLLGRIIELHHGKDNKVRVVTLQCKDGSRLTRPFSKIVLLPTDPPMVD